MTSTRRDLLAAVGALVATSSFSIFPAGARAEPIELEWSDLIPGGADEMSKQLPGGIGIVEHDQISTPQDQSALGSVTSEYNGKTVRLPGFVIPLDYSGASVTSLLLVPYVGACIHVPPPPPNQLVFVTTDKPYEFEGLFEAVWVTGVFGTLLAETELAEVGYSISEGRIEHYRWE